nr:MAG TPA: hypothetical protein [Caudoviricetes sp.]
MGLFFSSRRFPLGFHKTIRNLLCTAIFGILTAAEKFAIMSSPNAANKE